VKITHIYCFALPIRNGIDLDRQEVIKHRKCVLVPKYYMIELDILTVCFVIFYTKLRSSAVASLRYIGIPALTLSLTTYLPVFSLNRKISIRFDTCRDNFTRILALSFFYRTVFFRVIGNDHAYLKVPFRFFLSRKYAKVFAIQGYHRW